MSTAVHAAFSTIVYFGFHIYEYCLIPILANTLFRGRLPHKAPKLDKLDFIDNAYITFNKLVSILFVYHSALFVMNSGMECDFYKLLDKDYLLGTLAKVPLQYAIFFVFYDFVYTLFHWALHIPFLYTLIHKHHHKQMSPFRGNKDAINVHPFEYVTGEYNHLFTLFVALKVLGPSNVHAVSYVLWVFLGGCLASLNHTRVNVHIPYIFNVAAHDFHHRKYRCNYGQYTMLWDAVFGTWLPSD